MPTISSLGDAETEAAKPPKELAVVVEKDDVNALDGKVLSSADVDPFSAETSDSGERGTVTNPLTEGKSALSGDIVASRGPSDGKTVE